MPGPWRQVELEAGVGFAVPPDAIRGGGTAVDSIAGSFDGEGYRITYDLGRFGESLDDYADAQGYERLERRQGRHRVTIVSFAPEDEPFAWARVMQLELGDGRTLTLRVSCPSRQRCDVADGVFDSVEVDRP